MLERILQSALAQARTVRKSRSLWWLGGMLLAALTLKAVPESVIRLNGAQLRGMIGTYTDTGWKPVPRPNAGFTPSDYDWTGMSIAWSWTMDGQGGSSTVPFFGGFDNWDMISSDRSSVAMDSSGISTYKWDWDPPVKDGTHDLDLTNFPKPDLYVFAVEQVSSMVSAHPDDPALTGGGSVADDWGNLASFDSVSGFASLQSYGILPAHSESDLRESALLLASCTVHATLGPNPAQPVTADIGVYEGQAICPLTLAAPFWYMHPKALGDGGNQFAYDGSGNLAISANISASLASESQLADWTGSLDWTIDIPGGGGSHAIKLPYTKVASGSSVVPRTQLGGMSVDGSIVYSGLPVSNSDLGNHQVIMQVLGGNSMLANIQTFVSPVNNHPVNSNADLDSNGTAIPNWLYYYRQLYPLPANSVYDPSLLDGGSYNPDTDLLRIGGTAVTSVPVPVFAIRNNKVTWIGQLTLKGIHAYLFVVGHELGHRLAYQSGIMVGPAFPGPDADNDGLNDDWEAAHGFVPGQTTDVCTDAEVLGHINGLAVLTANWGMQYRDWVVGGVLWGPLQYPADQPQWQYEPRMGNGFGTATNVLPNDALTAVP